MEQFARFIANIIGGSSNGRIVIFVGLLVALLAALPDLIPTLIALLSLLPIKEESIANLAKGVESIKQWSPWTRRIMALSGVVVLGLGVVVIYGIGPVAKDDQLVTNQGESVLFNVLVNDNDPDGGKLTLTFWNSTSAKGGKVDCASDGSCNYTPPPNFSGEDSFTYDVSYGKDSQKTARATVHIQVRPREIPATATNTNVPSVTPTSTETPQPPTPTPTPTFSPTPSQTSLPITTTLTTAPTPTFTPTGTLTPTPTRTPTLPSEVTVTPTPTGTPSPTFSPGDATLTTRYRLNVRRGPGLEDEYGYPLTSLNYQQTVLILGVSSDRAWWKIQCPSGITSQFGCWVSSNPDYSDTQNTENVPVIPNPPTPTPVG